MKTCMLLTGLIASQFICLAGDKPSQVEKPVWDRGYQLTTGEDGKDRGLNVFNIRQGPIHLESSWVLERLTGTLPQLVIQGHFNKVGEFAANVSLEVSDQEEGGWKTIASSFSDKVDVTLTGGPQVDKLFFVVQLDALQPYIGKFKFCRIALQTGESYVFPMAWLTEKGE